MKGTEQMKAVFDRVISSTVVSRGSFYVHTNVQFDVDILGTLGYEVSRDVLISDT